MREDPRICFAHTLRHLLVEDVHFLFLGPPGWTFFRVNVKADLVTSTLLHGLPMGTPWLLVSDDASIFCARKKRVNNKYLCDKKPRFPVFHISPRMHARATAKPLYVSKRVKAFTRPIHTWAFQIWPPINQNEIFELSFSISIWGPRLNAKELAQK
jgi:hypothetical protein